MVPVFELYNLPEMGTGFLVGLVLLILLGSLILAVLSYQKTTKPLSLSRKGLLLGLRLAAVLLALACLFRPTLETVQRTPVKGKLNIALDASGSMDRINDANSSVYGVGGDQPRSVVLQQMLRKERPRLDRLEKAFDVTYTAFATDPTPTTLPEAMTSDGPLSNYGKLLQSNGSFQRILVVGDGVWNTGSDPAEEVRHIDENTVIHTVAIGLEQLSDQLKDIRGIRIRAKDTIALNARIPIEATFQFLGLSPRDQYPLRILINGHEVDSKPASINADGYATVRFVQPFDTPGIYRVRIESRVYDWEIESENNWVEKSIRVIKKGITVRYIESFRWEAKFIARELGSWDKIDFKIISGLTHTNPTRLLPEDEHEWGFIDVLILGNVERSILDRYLPLIRDRVETGAGLLMIGGRNNFGPGGYAGSALADPLPVVIDPRDAHEANTEKPIQMIRTPEGIDHFLLRLEEDPEDDLEAWALLPPSAGITRTRGAKEGTLILLQNQDHDPLLVTGQYGAGRTMAMLTESTWRWVLNDLKEPEATRAAEYHRKFWRQLVLWLANREELRDEGVALTLEGATSPLEVGEDTSLVVRVSNAQGEPVTDAKVEILVALQTDTASSEEPTRYTPGYRLSTESHAAQFRPSLAGTYRVTATATRNGEELGTDEMEINVRLIDHELDSVVANYETLRNLALHTGGLFATPDGTAGSSRFSEVLDSLLEEADSLAYISETSERLQVWTDSNVALYGIFILFCVCLSLEWFFRKRFGLV